MGKETQTDDPRFEPGLLKEWQNEVIFSTSDPPLVGKNVTINWGTGYRGSVNILHARVESIMGNKNGIFRVVCKAINPYPTLISPTITPRSELRLEKNE